MRRAEELALQIVGPAMNRANDIARIALARQHDRLPMPADVRQELDALRVAHERLRVRAPRQRVVITRLGHHELVAHVSGGTRKQQPALGVEDARIGVPGNRKLWRSLPQPCGGSEVRHGPTLSAKKSTNPTKTAGKTWRSDFNDAGSAGVEWVRCSLLRTVLLSRPREGFRGRPRRQN